MIDTIRTLLDEYARLPVKAETLDLDQDLYAAGLSSHSAVQLMLALEDRFDFEFPDPNRRTFASISAIAARVSELAPSKAA